MRHVFELDALSRCEASGCRPGAWMRTWGDVGFHECRRCGAMVGSVMTDPDSDLPPSQFALDGQESFAAAMARDRFSERFGPNTSVDVANARTTASTDAVDNQGASAAPAVETKRKGRPPRDESEQLRATVLRMKAAGASQAAIARAVRRSPARVWQILHSESAAGM